MNILILDDDQSVCDIVSGGLEIGDHVCSVATDLEYAKKLCEVSVFDAIVVDLVLEGYVQGDEFAKEYKEKHPECLVYIITGKDVDFISGLHVDGFFRKPIKINDLLKRIGDSDMPPNSALCEEHTQALRELTKRFDKYELQQSKMYRALCGGIDDNGKHVEGQLAKWKTTHTFLKVITSIMSTLFVAFIGICIRCAPVILKAANIVENSNP